MTTEIPPIEAHAVHRDRLLDHARRMIEQGDRLQASEKIWGAVTYGLKAVTEERGWPYASHQDGYVLARHISLQTGNPAVFSKFRAASDVHQNFYEDRYSLEDLAMSLADAEELLLLLREAHEAMPPDTPLPSDARYLARHGI